MTLRIRTALPEEHLGLLDLVTAGYAEFDGLLPEDYPFLEDAAALMAGERTEVIVAEADGVPVGTITFCPDGESYHEGVPSDWAGLRTLAVLPSARGLGAGRALMNESLRRARALGRTRMLLHTLPAMTAAIALHESLGFRRVPDLDFVYSPDLVFVAYALDL
ncbi:MAG: GNAT family N-acetyltransferase [Actinomycetota bacterium]